MLDAHIHYLRPEWAEALWSPSLQQSSALWPQLRLRMALLDDPRLALAALDAHQIERAIIYPELSVAPGPQTPGGQPAALAITRQMNDITAALAAHYAGRLYGLAVVNPLGTEADLAELHRAIVVLGLHGVAVGASYRGATVDSNAARPFLALVEALEVPLVIHPAVGGPGHEQRDFGLDLLLGVPMDLTRAALRLIVSGRLAEFPRLRIVLPHLGGALPALLGWIAVMAENDAIRSGDALRHFWVDTATATPATLTSAIIALGADRVMLGTDWPIAAIAHTGDPRTDPIAMIAALPVTPLERRALLEGTARQVFGV